MTADVWRLVVVVCLAWCAAGQPGRDGGCGGPPDYGQNSPFVLTGTVLRLDRKEGRAEVRVKRVLRGREGILPDTTVRVEGATGAPCHGDPKLRARDSRIFMLEKTDRGAYRLHGTLLRITVPNLDRVTAVVKGEPYHRRAPILDLACEQKYCPWGGECVETRQGGARCQCPDTCPVGYAPVCGSNGATYVNECRLRRESCRAKARIFLSHTGPCPTATAG